MTRHPEFTSMRRTPSELRRNSGPQPPLGEFYWKPTRQIRFPSPIVSIRGRYRDQGVHCTRGGVTYFRDYVIPADPKTERQVEQRQCLGSSQAVWKDVPAAERDAWTAYGQKYFAHEMSSSPGPNAFSKAQSCRRGWGGAMSWEAPVLPPPPMPLRLVEIPAPEAGQVAFRLEHTMSVTANYRLELRMTAATINGRKPQEPQFSRAGETAAESFFPLAESGAAYLLAQPRHQVAPGERFGLGARLITPEGIPGPELRVDLVRLPPEQTPPAPPETKAGRLSFTQKGLKLCGWDVPEQVELRASYGMPLTSTELFVIGPGHISPLPPIAATDLAWKSVEVRSPAFRRKGLIGDYVSTAGRRRGR